MRHGRLVQKGWQRQSTVTRNGPAKQEERIVKLSVEVREASNRGEWFDPIELFDVLQASAKLNEGKVRGKEAILAELLKALPILGNKR